MTWIQTKRAFLSVVAYNPANDREPNSPFRDFTDNKHTHVLVRARLEEHIKDLETVVPNLVWQSQPHADYRYRAVIKREQWAQYLMRTVEEMDYYSHYKEVVRDAHPSHLRSAIYSTMMSIWGKYASMQPTTPYTGKSRHGKQNQLKNSEKTPFDWDRWSKDHGYKGATKPKQLEPPKQDSLLDDVDSLLDEMNDEPVTDRHGRVLTEDPDGSWDWEPKADQIGSLTVGAKLKDLILRGKNQAEIEAECSADLPHMTDEAFELYVRVLESEPLTEKSVDEVAAQLKKDFEEAEK